jgi:hypothetical protein
VPRIPRNWLKLVVFIYPDKTKALGDQKGGGTGFFVARQVEKGWQSFIVTNRHVIDKLQNPVIRLNQIGTEEPDLCITNRLRWIDHPDGDDLSVCPLDFDTASHRHAFIEESGFSSLDNQHLGLGSEVVMLGRFVGLSGQPEVRPVARFGHIAHPEIFVETNSFNAAQETFVIECHAVPGFSGSPVLAYLPSNAANEEALENSGIGPFLLGVIWKHFGNPEDVLDEKLQPIGAQVKGNSGLAGVIPSAKISKILTLVDKSASFRCPEASQTP